MDKQHNSEANEHVRSGYDAPRAQRLSDAVTATGNVCQGDGNSAGPGCSDGGSATSCLTFGSHAYQGCQTGTSARECGSGNYAAG